MSYLLLAIGLSTMIVVAFKIFATKRIDIHTAITTNYFIAMACGMVMDVRSVEAGVMDTNLLLLSILLGITFIVVFHLFAISAAKAGVAITAVSSKMSVVIPVLAGVILFSESLNAMRSIAILIALLSFILILWNPASRIDWRFIALPLLIFIGNGINDSLLKYAQFTFLHIDGQFIPFLTRLFLFSWILGSIHLLYRIRKGSSRVDMKSLISGFVLGLLNWGSTYFFLKGLDIFDVSLFVPSYNAGVVITSALVGWIIFREQLTWKNWLGISLATLAIIVIAYPPNGIR